MKFYRAYTSKIYRIVEHIVCPVIFTLFGMLIFSTGIVQREMTVLMMALLIIMECCGEYVSFMAVCDKNASPVNWVKSSHRGVEMIKCVYLWDVVIKAVKHIIIWALLSIFTIRCGNWEYAMLGYLLTLIAILGAANLIRRIDNIQLTTIITAPFVAVAGAVFVLITGNNGLIIPGIIVLILIAVAEMVVTYRFSVKAYEDSFHDVR